MIYTQKIHTDLQINTLEDLAKLKPFLEDGTLKVNKSQIARELGKDRRTVDKYLKGYKKPTTRHKGLLLMIITTSSGNFYQMKTSRFSITNVFCGSF